MSETEPEVAATRFVIAMFGSRDYWPDDDIFAAGEKMRANHATEGILIRTGDARGVDEAVMAYCQGSHVPYVSEPARWDKEGGAAGHNRNTRVLAPDVKAAIAFLHPQLFAGLLHSSPGTCDGITQARDKGIPTYVHHEGRWMADGQIQRIVDQVHTKWEHMKGGKK